MAAITIQSPTATGAVVTTAAASAGGDTFVNDGHTVLTVINGGVGSVTVTINAEHLCNFGFDHDGGGAVANGATKQFGPFPQARFGTTVEVTYTGVTDVTVSAVSMA